MSAILYWAHFCFNYIHYAIVSIYIFQFNSFVNLNSQILEVKWFLILLFWMIFLLQPHLKIFLCRTYFVWFLFAKLIFSFQLLFTYGNSKSIVFTKIIIVAIFRILGILQIVYFLFYFHSHFRCWKNFLIQIISKSFDFVEFEAFLILNHWNSFTTLIYN